MVEQDSFITDALWNAKEKEQYGQCYYWAPPRDPSKYIQHDMTASLSIGL